MEDFIDDEHDEDDLPDISVYLPKVRQEQIQSKTSNNSLQKWEKLYQTTLRSIENDDDDDDDRYHQRENIPRQPIRTFQIQPEKPKRQEQKEKEEKEEEEEFYIAKSEQPFDSRSLNSKWKIRLPQLLNGTVGPDRQKRDVTRRHTTEIVFQQQTSSQTRFNSSTTRPTISPLVKQLRQKFDRMSVSNDSRNNNSNHSTKIRRVSSLTGRGLNNPTKRWMSPTMTSDHSTGTITRPTGNLRGPPVSYRKHFQPPPSATSVVKQLLDGGATLIYESSSPRKTSNTNSTNASSSKSVKERTELLKDSKLPLTGRQLPSNNEDPYSTIPHTVDKNSVVPSNDDENPYYAEYEAEN